MAEGVDAAFSRFVAERRPALLGTALLLTGDRAAAEDLVQRALTRVRRAWPRDPGSTVLRFLVDGATSRWPRLIRAEQVIETLPDPFASPFPAEPDERPDLARGLRELPPRTRAVVVLRWHERLPDDRTAQLLGCPVDTVTVEATRGLDRLRPALAPSAYARAAADIPAEQLLPDQLAGLAEAADRWRLDTDQAIADIRSRRHSSRRRRLAVGAVATLCAVGVTVPLARRAPEPSTQPAALPASAAASVPGATPPPIAPRRQPVLTGPTRGSLAGEAAFLDAVRSEGWGAEDAPPPGDRQVVFAGDTPDGRAALVVGSVHGNFRGVWLTGPAGAPAADLAPHVPHLLAVDRPLGLLLGGPGDATLVVIAAPGDEVAVSDRLMTGPRGTVERTYTPVAAADGVAVVAARTTRLGPALSVRISREGRVLHRAGVDWAGERPDLSLQPAVPAPLRPGRVAADPGVVAAALSGLAVPLGVEPPALEPELLWSGELPVGRGAGSVAVLVARSPGGALVVTTWAGGSGGAVSCGTQTPPGATEVATLTIARVCHVQPPGLGQADDGRWLVVSAPPGAASAELLDSRGRVLGPLPLDGGGAVVPLPEGAGSVRTLDAAGQPLRETPIAPTPSEPFGDFGPGPER